MRSCLAACILVMAHVFKACAPTPESDTPAHKRRPTTELHAESIVVDRWMDEFRTATMVAQTATFDRASDVIRLSRVEISFRSANNAEPIIITAEEGRVMGTTHETELAGSVELKKGGGLLVRADRAHFPWDDGMVTTSGPAFVRIVPPPKGAK